MQKIHKYYVLVLVVLLSLSNIAVSHSILDIKKNVEDNILQSLDFDYIYNLTERLSNIIFTEYNESNGEIAKGREFGTKGEHKAADILYENMTALGLYTKKERIVSRFPGDFLTTKVDVLNYSLKLVNNSGSEFIDCGVKIVKIDYSNFYKIDKYDLSFDLKGLKLKTAHPSEENDNEDYVLIEKKPILNYYNDGLTFYDIITKGTQRLIPLENDRYDNSKPHCKAEIVYRQNNSDEHDMNYFGVPDFPVFYINESIGDKICKNIENYTIDIQLNQKLNKSVESYNVVGQLNGTDPGKTIIVASLYDSWWCQGTGDSAIGTSIVLGIAKYFIENKITPRCNIKFIAFGGEEHGCKGTIYYEYIHKHENVEYFIDINQIGFYQKDPRMKLNIVVNSRFLREKIFEITNKSNYIERTGNVTDFNVTFSSVGHSSNDRIYALKKPYFLPFKGCKTISFLKEGAWIHHHKDGVNHTEGDVIDYYDEKDVEVTSEMILNVTKYLSTDIGDSSIFCVKDFPVFFSLKKFLNDLFK